MSKKNDFIIGIDLGGTKILFVLFDSSFRIKARFKTKTKIDDGRKTFFDALHGGIRTVLQDARVKSSDLGAIGIGTPGIIHPEDGKILVCPNIPFLKGVSLSSEIGKVWRVPAIVENDVNAGLYGEYHFGSAKGHRNVVGIFMGTGIGGGLIINGQLYRGSSGAAGEIGHTRLDSIGHMYGCGQKGCLEAFAGRLAIASEAAAISAKQQAPSLFKEAGADLLEMKSSVLKRSIESGDVEIEKLLKDKARLVGWVVSNVANLLNPDLFVLGGGVVEALPKLIIHEVIEVLHRQALKPIAKAARVVTAKLGDDAIVMGAAKLASEEMRGL